MTKSPEAIAVIGLSGRFPQAKSVEEFWENMRQGRECTTQFSPDDLLKAGVQPEELSHPNYVPVTACVDDIDLFDAEFFGFNPRDAEILDPQHRLFLECAWETLEDAGYDPGRFPGLIGVFAGASMSTYAFQLYSNPRLAGLVNDFQILISNDKDHLCTRAAYKCGLRGPAVTVGTACSTSLVAVCLACENLLDYQCDLALAGGVTLNVPQRVGYVYQEGGIASPDGHCRSFDAQAAGTVGGNGVAVVLLKRLSEAIEHGDAIRAVLRGYGLNNDGAEKVGYTAPSVTGQAEAIAMALAMSGVEPESISMLEAHGTATPLGDPIEFLALCQAYRRARRHQYCALGSVKSNVGHMDAAAGAAGLIKCVLSLQHRQIPASLHFDQPNPKIDLTRSPFFVNTRLRDWQSDGAVRRAGVSSFGIGGTNAHVILEEAPTSASSGPSRPFLMLGLSARSTKSLDAQVERLAIHIEQNQERSLPDAVYTLRVGRHEMPYRCACVVAADAPSEAVSRLRSKGTRGGWMTGQAAKPRSVIFLFPGHGAQHPKMALGLYKHEFTFRTWVDTCAEILQPILGVNLRTIIYSLAIGETEAGELLRQTWLAQPALFVTSFAMAKLWMHWGVTPTTMIGHSIGEYVAACLSGVFQLEDALRLVAERGRLLEATPSGAMIAVGRSAAELESMAVSDIAIAAVNAPGLTVLSGSVGAIEQLEQRFRAEGIIVSRLHTTRAFHSPLVEAAVQPFSEAVSLVQLRPPSIPFISNVTGTWIRASEAQDPAYWGRHISSTVRFSQGIGLLLQNPDSIFLEVGPGTSLTSLVRQHRQRRPEALVLASARHPLESQSDEQSILNTVARLWVDGADIRWTEFYQQETRHRVSLPTYPFERKRYWIEPAPAAALTAESTSPLGRLPIEDWFYRRHWIRESAPRPPDEIDSGTWLIVGPELPIVQALQEVLEVRRQPVIRISPNYERAVNHEEALKSESLGYRERFRTLREQQTFPRRIIWIANPNPAISSESSSHTSTIFLEPLELLQAAVSEWPNEPLEVTLITWQGQRVRASDRVASEQSLPMGLVLTLPQEYPQVYCRLVDLDMQADEGLSPADPVSIVESLVAETMGVSGSPFIAYRRSQRWRLSYESAPLVAVREPKFQGSYLITGGLGKIGLLVAEFLARNGASQITLIGRRSVSAPIGVEYKAISVDSWMQGRIKRIRAIEERGINVRVIQADLADLTQMRTAVDVAKDAEGRIRGVFHAAGATHADAYPAFSNVRPAHIRQHFAPKVIGTQILSDLIADSRPDFVCCFSSLSTVLGGLGFVPYAAANHYLDAVSSRHAGAEGTRWVSIAWDGWALETGSDDEIRASSEAVIVANEGLDALARILSDNELDHVIVSTSDLGRRLAQWTVPSAGALPEVELPSQAQHTRPELKTAFVAPAPGLEDDIAKIWSELLGITEIGAFDNFFELGGHSLLAIQVVSRLREKLKHDLPVRVLFDHPTVTALAAAVQTDLVRPSPDELRRILDQVESLQDMQLGAGPLTSVETPN